MSAELDALFPLHTIVTIRGTEYPIKKITVAQMSSANKLSVSVFNTLGSELKVTNEMDVVKYVIDALVVLLDGGELQRHLERLVNDLVGITPEVFATFSIDELVEVAVALAKENSDFFLMRIPQTLRQAVVLTK